MVTIELQARDTMIKPGDAIPDFTLQTQDRAEWKLSDAVKKGDVVLALFPFAFTGTCGTEMKCVSKDMTEWSKNGAQVVGMSCDSPFVLKAWAQAEGFKHTMLSDQHRAVTKALGFLWAEMNTTQRGTIVIPQDAGGKAKAKHVESRTPGDAMKWEDVLAMIS